MTKIDTVEDYLKIRGSLEPVYVESTQGKIEVPCCNTFLVKRSLVISNTYNPNSVSADKMQMLYQSIVANGVCFPIVTIFDEDQEKFIIVDGFHRNVICGPEWLDLEYVPIVILKHGMAERMMATIFFNKAKGTHQVDLDSEIIRALLEQGLTEEQIAEKLCMELDAVHRYKQITGVAELFKNAEHSLSWEMVD